jgi:N-acetylglucosaminyldiphosphoundecaprenol N-acetyl-beta-D-mannosaminyltransferase
MRRLPLRGLDCAEVDRIRTAGAGAEPLRIDMLGCPLDPLDMAQTVARCVSLLEQPGTSVQVSVNAAKLVASNQDPDLAAFIGDADLVNADGQSVVWGARLLGHDVPERVAGIDLMQELIALAAERGLGIYVLGSRDVTLNRALEHLRARHPSLKVSGFENGYYSDADESQVVERIRASGAELLFVAMSSPRKEDFVARNRDRLGVSLTMGVGGAVDVLAGATKRAPMWMQRAGLEWLYRVVQEPRRMWRRYLVGNLRFAKLVLGERLRGRRS